MDARPSKYGNLITSWTVNQLSPTYITHQNPWFSLQLDHPWLTWDILNKVERDMSGFFPPTMQLKINPKPAIPEPFLHWQMCGHQPYRTVPKRRAGLPKRVQVAKQTKALQSMQWRGCSWDPCRPGLLDWDPLQDHQFTQTVWVYSNVGIFVISMSFLWVFWGSRWACKTFLEYSIQRVVWPLSLQIL